MSDVIKVSDVLDQYVPGSGKDWSHEFSDLLSALWNADLYEDIKAHGVKEPVLLGDDGRVWDGHHRIVYAAIVGCAEIPFEDGRSGTDLVTQLAEKTWRDQQAFLKAEEFLREIQDGPTE